MCWRIPGDISEMTRDKTNCDYNECNYHSHIRLIVFTSQRTTIRAWSYLQSRYTQISHLKPEFYYRLLYEIDRQILYFIVLYIDMGIEIHK